VGGTSPKTDAAVAGGDAGDLVEPFVCDLPAASATLDPRHWLHPAQPTAGQTLTLSFQSQNTRGKDAPALVTEITDRSGTRTVSESLIIGDSQALYYFSFGNLAAGENCLVVRNGEGVEAAIKVDVASPGAGAARGDGVWKIVSNHQWTCAEQPEFGNLLTVKVRDEGGQPLEGVAIDMRWTDDTVFPVAPDDSALSFADHGQPKTMTTNGDGVAELLTPWGTGIRSPVDEKPGYVVFNVSVAGGASDTATEITTGIWDTDPSGCDYCAQDLRNTWGHWSYTVEFQRQLDATEICEVGIDHAGQAECSYQHFYHEEGRPSCLPVAP